MSANVNHDKEWKPCRCSCSIDKEMSKTMGGNSDKLSATFAGGCENSAVLHHGSYIRFGCLQFAFTIINYTSNPALDLKEKSEGVDDQQSSEESIGDANHLISKNNISSLKNDNDMEESEPCSYTVSECDENSQTSEGMEIDP